MLTFHTDTDTDTKLPSKDLISARLITKVKETGKSRARISHKGLREICGRERLHESFIISLREHLETHGMTIISLDVGGYGLLFISALEGAPTVTIDTSDPEHVVFMSLNHSQMMKRYKSSKGNKKDK